MPIRAVPTSPGPRSRSSSDKAKPLREGSPSWAVTTSTCAMPSSTPATPPSSRSPSRGGMDIYVPDTIDVEVGRVLADGWHGRTRQPAPARAGAPRIRILAYNLMGGIDGGGCPKDQENWR